MFEVYFAHLILISQNPLKNGEIKNASTEQKLHFQDYLNQNSILEGIFYTFRCKNMKALFKISKAILVRFCVTQQAERQTEQTL